MTSDLEATLIGCYIVLGTLLQTDGFFMGTKHTTPPTQLPMHNHNGKTYAKVGDQYVEYNDDEMYYDKHDRMKNQAELDKEDRAHFTDLKPAEPMSLSNSQTRREEKERAMEAWKQAKREEVDDVTGLPMYEGETYNQFGEMDYGKEPKAYGGGPLGGRENQYEEQRDAHQPPPLNPYYGGPGGVHPNYGAGGPDPNYGAGGPEPNYGDVGGVDQLAHLMNNPPGGRKYFPSYGGMAPNMMQGLNPHLANYLGNPVPQGILTLHPIESDETTSTHMTPPTTTTEITHAIPVDHYPEGLAKNISADDFEKYHGEHGNLNLGGYARNSRIVELNERRAAEAIERARRAEIAEFDEWTGRQSFMTEPKISTTKKPTTKFEPRADITIPDYICNFK